MIFTAIKINYITGYGYGLRCEFIDYPFSKLGCTGSTAQRRRVTRIFHPELYRLPDLLRGGEGNSVRIALVGNILFGIRFVLFGIPSLTLGNSDIGSKTNIALKVRFSHHSKSTGDLSVIKVGQAVHQAFHLFTFNLIAGAVELCQCGIPGYIQRFQLIVVAGKLCQRGVLGYIQRFQLIVVAVKIGQRSVLGYIQRGQLIVGAM